MGVDVEVVIVVEDVVVVDVRNSVVEVASFLSGEVSRGRTPSSSSSWAQLIMGPKEWGWP